MTEHLLNVPASLVEASKKMLLGSSKEKDKKDEKEDGDKEQESDKPKKAEKIILNPDLHQPNMGPNGHTPPGDLAGQTQMADRQTS
jgi:hypothetical protein